MELKRIGLVLPGGGSRGAYQLGVFLALKKYSLYHKVVVISGGSIGTFMSLLYHLDDLEQAYTAWTNINQEIILGYKKAIIDKIPLNTRGLFSRASLITYINHNFDLHLIMDNDIPTYSCCSRINKKTFHKSTYSPEYFLLNKKSRERILSIILASSAIPYIFDQEPIDGNLYCDCLKTDNEPVYPLLKYDIDSLIVVPLSKHHDINKFKGLDIPTIDLVSPLLQEEPSINMLDFEPEKLDYLLNLGYFTASTIFREMQERKLLGKKAKLEKNYYSLDNFSIEIRLTKLYSFSELMKDVERGTK